MDSQGTPTGQEVQVAHETRELDLEQGDWSWVRLDQETGAGSDWSWVCSLKGHTLLEGTPAKALLVPSRSFLDKNQKHSHRKINICFQDGLWVLPPQWIVGSVRTT